MKHTLFLSVALVAAFFWGTSCSPTSKNSNKATTSEQTTPTALSVDELLAQAESHVGQKVTIAGICTHTCKHGATKIFLMGSSDAQTLRVEAGPLGSFKTQCINSRVQVTGTLKEERIDEGYLLRWEEKLNAEAHSNHGETGEGGCATEKNARGETANTPDKRIADFRQRIAQRQASEGKAYLSFYFLEAEAYEIQ